MDLNTFLKSIQEKDEDFIKYNQEFLKIFSKEQHPFITLIECSDSRQDTSFIGFGGKESLNKVFRIENIGNTVGANEGSVTYGVKHLKTPLLIVLGHTNCGAVKAALFEYDEVEPEIRRELDYIKPALNGLENIKDFDERWVKGVEANLEYQVNYAYKKFKDLVKNKNLAILGFLIDTDNSFGGGYDKLYVKHIIAEDGFKFEEQN